MRSLFFSITLYIYMQQQLQIISGQMYKIKRRIKISHNPIVETWREHLRCDKVFMNKKEGYYYFCELVPEAEIVKEVKT